MNPWTLVGILGGLALLLVSIIFTARDPMLFVNLPGALVVLGGTLAATLMSFTPSQILKAISVIGVTLKTERRYSKDDVEEIVNLTKLWHSGSIAKVEDELKKTRSPFLKSAIEMVIDGTPVEDIHALLEWRISQLKTTEANQAKVYDTMAGYAPAFGMVGTLLGLVNMLYDVGQGAGVESIGANMAVALITTFYGVVLANALFKPMAAKLRMRTSEREKLLRMVMQGIILMNEQRTPGYLRATLGGFIGNSGDEVGEARHFSHPEAKN